jgi:tetratricopeptide (TPR) repeat protein
MKLKQYISHKKPSFIFSKSQLAINFWQPVRRLQAAKAYIRGVKLFKEKKTGEAIQEFQKAIDLNPYFFAAYLNKGYLLFRNMKNEEAEQSILKALGLKPDNAKAKKVLTDIYFEQSIALLRDNKFDLALEKLKAIYNVQPDYPYLNYLLGYTYYRKNIKEDAIKHLKLFLQQEPNSPKTGLARIALGDLEKAE